MTTPSVMWDDQTEKLSTVLALMNHLMPKVQSCCCDKFTRDNGKTLFAIT